MWKRESLAPCFWDNPLVSFLQHSLARHIHDHGPITGSIVNASSCAQCTVKPNKLKRQKSGEEKGLLQGHARRQVSHALKSPECPTGFQQSTFKSLVRDQGPRACDPFVYSSSID